MRSEVAIIRERHRTELDELRHTTAGSPSLPPPSTPSASQVPKLATGQRTSAGGCSSCNGGGSSSSCNGGGSSSSGANYHTTGGANVLATEARVWRPSLPSPPAEGEEEDDEAWAENETRRQQEADAEQRERRRQQQEQHKLLQQVAAATSSSRAASASTSLHATLLRPHRSHRPPFARPSHPQARAQRAHQRILARAHEDKGQKERRLLRQQQAHSPHNESRECLAWIPRTYFMSLSLTTYLLRSAGCLAWIIRTHSPTYYLLTY